MKRSKALLMTALFVSALAFASCGNKAKKEECCKEGEKKECCEKKDSTASEKKCCEAAADSTKAS